MTHELQVELQQAQSHIRTLQNTLEEYQREVEAFKSLKKRTFFGPGGRSPAMIDGFAVGDISYDNPDFSPSKIQGEIIGDAINMELTKKVEE